MSMHKIELQDTGDKNTNDTLVTALYEQDCIDNQRLQDLEEELIRGLDYKYNNWVYEITQLHNDLDT